MKLFVYGTLKSDKPAAHLMAGCDYLGETYLPDYALYRDQGLPVLVKDATSMVKGEVYKVPSPSPILERIDRYEGFISEDNENNLYDRVKAYTVDQEMVYVYIFNGPLTTWAERIEHGEW